MGDWVIGWLGDWVVGWLGLHACGAASGARSCEPLSRWAVVRRSEPVSPMCANLARIRHCHREGGASSPPKTQAI